ncbi:MAG TPA: hypothetical protein VMQ78_07715 [Candidatus Limnocylindria bacterium]|nr:hypothetical protein [Candidatus Limnocylindria bacterium]
MRLRGALLVVAIACTPQAPAPSASPAPVVRAAPQAVILQAADMPADYTIETDGEMTQDDLASGLGTTPAELKQRLATGYVRSFTKGGTPFVCCVIDSILIMTADEAAARVTATQFRARALDLGSVETDLGETIGDESGGFAFEHTSMDGVLITLTVLFRYANVVDAVEVTGRPGSFERPYVLEIAKKQLQRLRADAEKR